MYIKEDKKKTGKLHSRIFYSLLGLTTLFFILTFVFESAMFLLLSVLVLFLSIITGVSIFASASPKRFGFVLLFSIIFLIFTGVFYSFIEAAYPYKVYSFSPQECRARMISWCTTCKVLNWVEGPEFGEDLARCSMNFGIDWTADKDCTDAREVCEMVGVPS